MAGRKQQQKQSRAARTPETTRLKPGLLFLAAALVGGSVWWWSVRARQAPMPQSTSRSQVVATVANAGTAPGQPPEGMVWIPGGEFSMGATEQPGMNDVGMQATTDSRPIHRVYVDGFWMDATEVTNGQFAQFVEATKYVTVAERAPRAEDFPGAPVENLVAGAVVFAPPSQPVPLNDHFQWWTYVKGANWRHPEGPPSNLDGRDQYPVVQIAYDYAVAYATWAGKRLPTEAEWEFAARGGLSGKLYPWGDEFMPARHAMANSHQGHFPDHDNGDDGFRGIGPVAQFGANGYGLYDVAGNVWEWTRTPWTADHTGPVAPVPACCGPEHEHVAEQDRRVMKGGSHICAPSYCHRYRPAARQVHAVRSTTSHLGFRCVLRS